MDNKITIAIDGYSSTGKSTVAKELAKELGYIYVDSGAMYRAVTLYAHRNKLVDSNFLKVEKLIESLDKVHLSFTFNNSLGYAEIFLNNENVEGYIRSLEISNLVSKVSAIPEVRTKLVAEQNKIGKDKGIVMDGRDIGTVVFPDAELKLFMTSSAEVRAQRRYKELLEKGDKVTFEEVLENVTQRDLIDTTREVSPLVKAHDAIEIDNSNLTREEQFSKILDLVNERLN